MCSPIYVRHMEYNPFLPHVSEARIFLAFACRSVCLWIIWSVHSLMASRAVSSRDKCPISDPLLKSMPSRVVQGEVDIFRLYPAGGVVVWEFFKFLQYYLMSLSFVIILAFLLVYLHASG